MSIRTANKRLNADGPIKPGPLVSRTLADLKKSNLALFHISGWWDAECISTKQNYARMNELDNHNQWLINGPWPHIFNKSRHVADMEASD